MSGDAVWTRRRRGLWAACASVAVLSVTGGCGAARPGPSASSASEVAASASSAALPVAPANGVSLIVNESELWSPSGRRYPLSEVDGRVDRAYQTRDGWLLGVYGDHRTPDLDLQLWLLRPDGSLRKLIGNAGYYPAVAPDGRHFAWVARDRMYTGHLTDAGTLAIDRSTVAPIYTDASLPGQSTRQGYVARYTGEVALIGASMTGGGVDLKDTWVPARGEYKPSWDKTKHVASVLALAGDGRDVLGFVRSDQPRTLCLALFDANNNLAVLRKNCAMGPVVDHFGSVSPGGRWLVLPQVIDGKTHVAIYDLTKVFDDPSPTVYCCLTTAVTSAAWFDTDTLWLQVDRARVLRVRSGGPQFDLVDVPGVPANSSVVLVPRLS